VKILPYGSAPEMDVNPDFARFWASYPEQYRIAKGSARKAWLKLKPNRQLVEQIMAKLAQQKQSEKWQNGYVVSPERYLLEERWEDYCGPERRVEQRREWVCPHDPPCHARTWCTSGVRDARDAQERERRDKERGA
jgi:ferredoxin-thioredoxin reductase catalytic subunit